MSIVVFLLPSGLTLLPPCRAGVESGDGFSLAGLTRRRLTSNLVQAPDDESILAAARARGFKLDPFLHFRRQSDPDLKMVAAHADSVTPCDKRLSHGAPIHVKQFVGHWCDMARDDPQFRIRLPSELKEKVEASAHANSRSLNGEIVHRLEASLSQKDSFQPDEASGADVKDKLIYSLREIIEKQERIDANNQKIISGQTLTTDFLCMLVVAYVSQIIQEESLSDDNRSGAKVLLDSAKQLISVGPSEVRRVVGDEAPSGFVERVQQILALNQNLISEDDPNNGEDEV